MAVSFQIRNAIYHSDSRTEFRISDGLISKLKVTNVTQTGAAARYFKQVTGVYGMLNRVSLYLGSTLISSVAYPNVVGGIHDCMRGNNYKQYLNRSKSCSSLSAITMAPTTITGAGIRASLAYTALSPQVNTLFYATIDLSILFPILALGHFIDSDATPIRILIEWGDLTTNVDAGDPADIISSPLIIYNRLQSGLSQTETKALTLPDSFVFPRYEFDTVTLNTGTVGGPISNLNIRGQRLANLSGKFINEIVAVNLDANQSFRALDFSTSTNLSVDGMRVAANDLNSYARRASTLGLQPDFYCPVWGNARSRYIAGADSDFQWLAAGTPAVACSRQVEYRAAMELFPAYKKTSRVQADVIATANIAGDLFTRVFIASVICSYNAKKGNEPVIAPV